MTHIMADNFSKQYPPALAELSVLDITGLKGKYNILSKLREYFLKILLLSLCSMP